MHVDTKDTRAEFLDVLFSKIFAQAGYERPKQT